MYPKHNLHYEPVKGASQIMDKNGFLQWRYHYSKTEAAMSQRIRRLARSQELVALSRKGLWYFADYRRFLRSSENGLTSEEALAWLNDEDPTP